MNEASSNLDLEDRLLGDASGEYRKAVIERLSAMRNACAAARRQLSDRDTFRKLQAATSAIEAALVAVEVLPRSGNRER